MLPVTLLPLPDSVAFLPVDYPVPVHTLLATEPDSKAPVSSNLSTGGHVTFSNGRIFLLLALFHFLATRSSLISL